MKQIYLMATVAAIFVSGAHAADISTDIRAGSGGPDYSDGGYFEFGVGLNNLIGSGGARFRTEALLSASYRYRGFFFEASDLARQGSNGAVDGINMGLNLWLNDRWAFDLLAASATARSASIKRTVSFATSPDPEREEAVLSRNTYYRGAGIRLTGYFGNTLFQYRLVDDIDDGNGITSSARVGYSRQVQNWSIHGVLGATYTSQETGQYWYGVSAEEASTRFPQYDVGSSTINFLGEVGASYPLRENVVFRSTAYLTKFDDDIAKSPLQDGEYSLRWNTSLSYVF